MNHQHHTDCKETLVQLNTYIDGELDPLLCAKLEAHIDNCTDCRIFYNTLKKTIQICQSDGKSITLPPDARRRLLASLGLEDQNGHG